MQRIMDSSLASDLSGGGHHIYNCGIQGMGIMFLGPPSAFFDID